MDGSQKVCITIPETFKVSNFFTILAFLFLSELYTMIYLKIFYNSDWIKAGIDLSCFL